MTINASKVASLIDAADNIVLRDADAGAETSTATEMPVLLPRIAAAYWADDQIAEGVALVQINVTALDTANGNETYVLSLQIDDTSDHSNAPITVASITVGAVGAYVVGVDFKTLITAFPNPTDGKRWLAIKATLAGTTPSIDYSATLTRKL